MGVAARDCAPSNWHSPTMSVPPPRPQSSEDLREHIVGKEVSSLHVYGINSLKSIAPAPADLAGKVATGVSASADGRQIEIQVDGATITIDLARAGTATPLTDAQPWMPSGRATPPTARLIFADGSGMDFKEPARTKRITLTIRER